MSANHAAFNLIFRFVENYVSPIAGRISSQRHVMAIRDGFISAMPFMIVGSFLLVFAYPPFSPDTTWGFARAWLDMAKQFEGQILTPDIHDWWQILMGLGRNWFYPDNTCPNLLDEGVDWKKLMGQYYEEARTPE